MGNIASSKRRATAACKISRSPALAGGGPQGHIRYRRLHRLPVVRVRTVSCGLLPSHGVATNIRRLPRGVAQPGRALRSGRRSRRFESCLPDHVSPKSRLRAGFFARDVCTHRLPWRSNTACRGQRPAGHHHTVMPLSVTASKRCGGQRGERNFTPPASAAGNRLAPSTEYMIKSLLDQRLFARR